MVEKVVPMIHVPDVRATVEWYRGIGFTVLDTYSNEGEGLSWAIVSFGSTEVMFNQGGQTSDRFRRDVDLYVYSDNVDGLYERLKDRVEIVEGLHDTFYGMREFIIRDLNRFWMTFAQPSSFGTLMSAVREGNAELVQSTLDRGLKLETLIAALAVATAADNQNAEIVAILKKAGAIPPPEVDAEVLRTYVGQYKGEHGFQLNITLEDNHLVARSAGQQPMSLMPVDTTTLRPTAFDGVMLIFNVESGSMAFKLGSQTMRLKRLEESKAS